MNKQLNLLVCLLLLTVAGCKVELHSSLGEQDANEMMAVLLNSGIDTEKLTGKDNTRILRVEKNQVARAVDILTELGYPKESYTNMGAVFRKKGMTSTPLEERARFIYALSQEISRTISEIDGVLSVRTHIVLPKNSPLDDTVKPSSAAVFIKCRDDKAITYNIPKIKQLVAGSIEGLAYDKVAVFQFTTARARHTGGDKEKTAPPPPDESKAGGSFSLIFWAKILALVLVSAGAGYLIRAKIPGSRSGSRLPAETDDD